MRAMRILVVENERLVAEDLKRSLEKKGYRVSAIVSEGKKALQTIEKQPGFSFQLGGGGIPAMIN